MKRRVQAFFAIVLCTACRLTFDLPAPTAVTKVEINWDNLDARYVLIVDDTTRYHAHLFCGDILAVCRESLTWSSSHPAVASVDQAGLVSALSVGTTSIIAIAGTKSDSATVTVVASYARSRSLGLGNLHSCQVTESFAAYCWGTNTNGQIGVDTVGGCTGAVTTCISKPRSVVGGLSFRTIASGFTQTCGVTNASAAYCWGTGSNGALGTGVAGTVVSGRPVPVVGGLAFASVSVGDVFACGLTNAGALYCWGDARDGRLGDATALETCPTIVPCASRPVALAPAISFDTLGTGTGYGCALARGGAVYCWGLNSFGTLGQGTTDTTARAAVLPITAAGPFTTLSVGSRHTCALTSAGATYCWGFNSDGQLGAGTVDSASHSTPTLVAGAPAFSHIGAGRRHTCALTASGLAYCWGQNSQGQLGDGTFASRLTPAPVSDGRVFTMISAGGFHTCGQGPRSTLCWGRNSLGSLGTGSLSPPTSSRPVTVQGPL